MKLLTIIWVIFYANVAFAINNDHSTKTISTQVMDIIDPPQTRALNIMLSTLSSLKALRKHNQVTLENTQALIKRQLLSNVAIDTTTQLTLKKHWQTLTTAQKSLFQQYIMQSLIKDYASIFTAYDKLNDINIAVGPKVKRKDNKAIVKLIISIDEQSKPFTIAVKMIQTDQWRIYDVVFSGVSLTKNYSEQFNSHIRRKGIESLIKKITKKIQ